MMFFADPFKKIEKQKGHQHVPHSLCSYAPSKLLGNTAGERMLLCRC